MHKPREFWINDFCHKVANLESGTTNIFEAYDLKPNSHNLIHVREVMPDQNISDLQIIITNAIEERDRLIARVKELESALDEFGVHKIRCQKDPSNIRNYVPCDCGLDEIKRGSKPV